MTTDSEEEPNFVSLLMADGLRRRTISTLVNDTATEIWLNWPISV